MVTTTKNQEKLRCKTKINFTGIYIGKERISSSAPHFYFYLLLLLLLLLL